MFMEFVVKRADFDSSKSVMKLIQWSKRWIKGCECSIIEISECNEWVRNMRSFKAFGIVSLILFLLLSAGSNEGNAEGEDKTKDGTTEGEKQAASADPVEIE